MGLSIPLDQLAFDLDDTAAIRLAIDQSLAIARLPCARRRTGVHGRTFRRRTLGHTDRIERELIGTPAAIHLMSEIRASRQARHKFRSCAPRIIPRVRAATRAFRFLSNDRAEDVLSGVRPTTKLLSFAFVNTPASTGLDAIRRLG